MLREILGIVKTRLVVLQNLSCIAKEIMVQCIKCKMQDNSESLGSMK